MADKKMTKKEMFGKVIELVKVAIELEIDVDFDGDEIIAFAEHEIEMLERKSSSKSKKEKEKEETDLVLMDIIKELLDGSEGMCATDIVKAGADKEEFDGVSSQKVVALLRKMIDAGQVEKFTGQKRKTLFKLV